MTLLLQAACAVAIGYQLIALLACLRQITRREPTPTHPLPPVSVLKPLHGPVNAEAMESHRGQTGVEFELLPGAHSDDPAHGPDSVTTSTLTPNPKVGKLIDLAARARHPVLVVNDADIVVPPGYLVSVTAPLADPSVGLVTCLYRGRPADAPGVWEALAIATDFAPNALVAPLVGVREFGLGSTLALRASDLAAIGGFASLSDWLADDYQLGKRITALGKRVHLSKTVVETVIPRQSWAAAWHHQVRWARTIRLSRGAYAGLPVTFATLWALAAAAAGLWTLAGAAIAARMAVVAAAALFLRCPVTARWWWLAPLRDLSGVAVWIAGLTGNTVRWGGIWLTIEPGGRICSEHSASRSVHLK